MVQSTHITMLYLLTFTSTTSFSNNLAMQGGATTANLFSTLIFDGSISFTNNGYSNSRYLETETTLSIIPHTTVVGKHETFDFVALKLPRPFIQREKCFFQLPNQNLSNGIDDVQLVFKNNSAIVAGSVLFGGVIDR